MYSRVVGCMFLFLINFQAFFLAQEKETGAVLMAMQFDRDLWQLTVDIEEADILPEDEDKQKCGKLCSFLQTRNNYI